MALWEYKVITSGKGGFATPQLLENFLNQLGKEEWEIVEFRSAPENFLCFTGLARRGTQRDWTLEAAAAAAAKAEAEQRKADERAAALARERETTAAPSAEPTAPPEAEPGARDESFRRPRDTELDQDPEALAEEAGAVDVGDWDDLPDEDELPTLFEAVRPHLRRNQKGPGQSVAIDYLAKRWEQEPDDITGALLECGFTIPEHEDSAPDYFEFEGDLYWLNKNNRGQLFLNVREKPRPAFRVTPVRKLDPSDPAAAELVAEHQAEVDRRADQRRQQEEREAAQIAKAEAAKAAKAAAKAAAEASAGPLPEGEALLALLRPRMRQNRRGGGFSGSTGFLAKALRQSEQDLIAGLTAAGLKVPEQGEKLEPVEIGGLLYWLNKDGRGGLWINGREKRAEGAEPAGGAEGETTSEGGAGVGDSSPTGAATPEVATGGEADSNGTETEQAGAEDEAEQAPDDAAAPLEPVELQPGDDVLVVLRRLLKPNRRGGGHSVEIGALSRAVNKPAVEILELLVRAGLAVPDDAKEKSVFVELGEEILWINRNPRNDSLWLNAKPKAAARRRGGRGRKKADAEGAAGDEAVAEDAADFAREDAAVEPGQASAEAETTSTAPVDPPAPSEPTDRPAAESDPSRT